jgi:hypothetical protein
VTLLSAWALAGVVLIAPLVLAHLRRQRSPLHTVPSLLIWEQLQGLGTTGERRLLVPRLPLLLALQALAVLLLVGVLARPVGDVPSAAGAGRALILDDSLWMSAPGRLAAGERELMRVAQSAPRGTSFAVVIAAGTPRVVYRGGLSGVADALAGASPATTPVPASLPVALSLAGALLAPSGRVTVARAPQDALPPVISAGELQDAVVWPAGQEQAIVSSSARCGIASSAGCELLAVVRNGSSVAVSDHYLTEGTGLASATGSVSVPPAGQAEIALSAVQGAHATVRLLGNEVLPAAASTSVSLPDANGLLAPVSVTLVGQPTDALPVARALAVVTGVRLRLRTPSAYRATEAQKSQIVVFDGTLPGGVLPQAPGVLLIDPPHLPGGTVGAVMREAQPSGSDSSSPLLEGVDLSSLSVQEGGAHALSLPGAVRWVAWSPEGPLLAYGQYAGRRLAVLSFDPSMSDLPQLSAFPLLVANLVRVLAGHPQSEALAGPPTQPSPVDLRAAAPNVAGGRRSNLAPWLLALALAVLVLEGAYAMRSQTRALRT